MFQQGQCFGHGLVFMNRDNDGLQLIILRNRDPTFVLSLQVSSTPFQMFELPAMR